MIYNKNKQSYHFDNQRIDFAIFNKEEEPLLFIEYDGEFHDNAEMHKGELELNKERDKRKNSKDEQLNIPIIRINYKEQNHINEPWMREPMKEFLGDF